jgi:hypothetical protein
MSLTTKAEQRADVEQNSKTLLRKTGAAGHQVVGRGEDVGGWRHATRTR